MQGREQNANGRENNKNKNDEKKNHKFFIKIFNCLQYKEKIFFWVSKNANQSQEVHVRKKN